MQPVLQNTQFVRRNSVCLTIINESSDMPEGENVDQRSVINSTPGSRLLHQNVQNLNSLADVAKILLQMKGYKYTINKRKNLGCPLLHSMLMHSLQTLKGIQRNTFPYDYFDYKKNTPPILRRKKKFKGQNNIGNITAILAAHKLIVNHALTVTRRNKRQRAILFEAVYNGDTAYAEKLVHEGISIKGINLDGYNIIHIAAMQGNAIILRMVLNHNDCNIDMINSLANNGYGPIHLAVKENNIECVQLLIEHNVDSSRRLQENSMPGWTPLHMAASSNKIEIAKILVQNKSLVGMTDEFGLTALHLASENGDIDMIKLLVTNGALVDIMTQNVSKPMELVENILDTYISTNDLNIRDPACRVTVDYAVLISDEMEQMKFLENLVKSGDRYGQRRLLLHPLVESFLYLKWKPLLPFFLLMVLLFHGFFVISLTMYILSEFHYKDKKKEIPLLLNSLAWQILLYCAVILNILQELLHLTVNRRYFQQFETWVKLGSICLTAILPCGVNVMRQTAAIWPRHVASVAILLSYLEMMILLSRVPKFGYYVLMFQKVAWNVMKVLFTFLFLLFGFALSFMIQFHSTQPFEGPWSALVKVLVMMTSEFDYQQLVEKKNDIEFATSISVVRLIFVAFAILAAIVLMNLMVGVAVNDLSELQRFGNIMRLVKQVEMLRSLESLFHGKIFCSRFLLHKIIKKRVYIEHEIELMPGQPINRSNKNLPSYLREAIFEKLHIRRKQIEEKKETALNRKKIEEIYEAIVNKTKKNKETMNNMERPRSQYEDTLAKLAELVKIQSLPRGKRRPNLLRKSQYQNIR